MKSNSGGGFLDGTWLEEEWFEMREVICRFKKFARRRGIKVVERRGISGGCMRFRPSFAIYVRRDTKDANIVGLLIHEFVHFELGHRGTANNEEYAREEIEACMVEHIVLWMFRLVPDPTDYIYRHAFWIPDLYRKAWSIALQLKDDVFYYGRQPKNHAQLMGR